MNIGFAVAAGIAALIALICLWFWKKLRDEAALMASTPTSRAADVAAMAPGTLVEVKGTIRCDAPILGEFSQQSCVYARSIIERRETRWRDGKSETHTVTERSTERHAPFYVEDESGRVLVRGEGADVESILVLDQSGNDTTASLISLASSLLGAGNFDRRFKEFTLGHDIPVYVSAPLTRAAASAPRRRTPSRSSSSSRTRARKPARVRPKPRRPCCW